MLQPLCLMHRRYVGGHSLFMCCYSLYACYTGAARVVITYEICCILSVGYCILFVGYHSLYVGCFVYNIGRYRFYA